MAQSSDLAQTFPTLEKRRRRNSAPLPINFRIVLLGKDVSANSGVGNIMLGRSAFESEAPPDVDDHHSERVRGKHMTLINCPHLLQPDLSYHHITQTVRECVSVCDPGPHVIILVLQHHDFTETDRSRVKHVLKEFSDEAIKRTILLTTETHSYISTSVTMNEYITDLMCECGGGHLHVDEGQAEWRAEMFRKIEEILKKEPDEYLKCEISRSFVDKELSVQDYSVRSEEDSSHKDDEKHTKSHQKRRDEENVQKSSFSSVTGKSKLNLVLCGTDARLKATISKLLRGKRIKALNQREFSSVCVKKEEKIHGHQIIVVELPALTRLSDEELLHQTFTAVSLCHPGVHVFLIIVPVGPLTHEDKEEVEKIQKIFYSSERFMMIFTTDVTVDRNVTDFVESYAECQRLISVCAGRHRVLGLNEYENLKPIELLDYIKDLKTEPYSLHMYMKSQENKVRHETEEKYEEKLSELTSKIDELQLKINLYGVEDEQHDVKHLRIVLIGKTGNGKSATGNTILGSCKFESLPSTDSVTTVCEKRVGEVDGRSVAVVDTPGLFDTTLSNEQIQDEIVKCVSLSAPGPQAFIIILCVGRFTQEESDTIDLIRMFFGPKVAQFSIILFTNRDKLQNESIEHFVNRSNNRELKKLLRDCGNRFLAFNNNETQDRAQVTQLFNMIDSLKSSNEGRYFTNSMFEEAEISIKKKMEKILIERESEIQSQKEELKAKHEIEMENMKKRLEDEKRKADEERLKMESKFKEKEETLRKEFEEKEQSEQQKREKEKQKRLEEEKQQRAEYHQKIEEMKRAIEEQRSLYEQEQKEREEEDRKREEKYRQDQEEMKAKEDLIIQLQKRQEEEIKKRDLDEQKRSEQEEREREEWTRKIKEAENDRKEIQEDIKRQQREWEEKMKQQMREREEDERKRKERHDEQLREKQEELEKMRKKFENEREEERRQREDERQKHSEEREEKEREYETTKNEMMKHYEQLERERKEEWKRQKQEDEERREEERKRWEKRIEDIKTEQEEEIKKRETQEREGKEREKKERREMKEEHERRIKEMKKKHEDEARRKAEEFNEFREKKEQHVQELRQMLEEYQKQHEILEKLYQHFKKQKGKEMKELRKAVEKLKNKSSCAVM